MKKTICFFLLLPVFLLSSAAYSAAAYAVLDADTGTLLAQSNADTRLPMASTTKIMTGLLAAEEEDPERIIEVPASCAGVEGSSMYLQAGEQLPLRDVLYGLLLCSGNDAAECIAAVCGGRDAFVQRMNERAAQLGLVNTHFDNPSGLDGETHYTTAAELAKLAAAALQNETFATVVATKEYTSGTHFMHNHNRLLSQYDGCIGVKTGFTRTAGRCLVSAAHRDGRTVVAVTLHDPDDWKDHAALLDAAFSTLERQTVVNQMQDLDTISVISSTASTVSLVCPTPIELSLFDGETPTLQVRKRGMLYAPVKAGTVCGSVSVQVNGTELASAPLVAARTIPLDAAQERRSLWDRILRFVLHRP